MYKQNNNPFSRNKYGESRGEGHKSGERFRYDPADKKAFESLNQVQKDSLHSEAMKYNKPFFSPKHGVNVDPEDGVLSNRPVYNDGSKLTYESISKPHSESNLNMNSSPLDFGIFQSVGRALGRRRGQRGTSKFEQNIMSKLDAISEQLSQTTGVTPQDAANPVQPAAVNTAEDNAIAAADMVANGNGTAASSGNLSADKIFGTPLERQRSVSKKYCKKNK